VHDAKSEVDRAESLQAELDRTREYVVGLEQSLAEYDLEKDELTEALRTAGKGLQGYCDSLEGVRSDSKLHSRIITEQDSQIKALGSYVQDLEKAHEKD
jgi:chromosome segregation ATPase